MKISSSDIESMASGRKLLAGKFPGLVMQSGTDYTVYNSTWMSDPKLCGIFGLTSKLYDRWMYYGIEFNIILTLQGDEIKKCTIDKFRETSASARPTVRALVITQQELRIARRILDHITLEP